MEIKRLRAPKTQTLRSNRHELHQRSKNRHHRDHPQNDQELTGGPKETSESFVSSEILVPAVFALILSRHLLVVRPRDWSDSLSYERLPKRYACVQVEKVYQHP